MSNTSNSFYSFDELNSIGFRSFGKNVLISRKVSIYSPSKITLGSNVRIDDFCILSGRILLGNYIHIAAYSVLYGSDIGITIGYYANISSRVSIYAVSDDYSGETMTNPMIPDEYKNVDRRPIHIGKHVIIASTNVVMPGDGYCGGKCFRLFFLCKGQLRRGAFMQEFRQGK